jgi:hypothetical protein
MLDVATVMGFEELEGAGYDIVRIEPRYQRRRNWQMLLTLDASRIENLARFRLMLGNQYDSVEAPPLIDEVDLRGLIPVKSFENDALGF